MTDEVQKGVTIGDANDPVRMAMRLQRLREAKTRAEGARSDSLDAEIARLEGRLATVREALQAAGAL
jgi:hypothetical protein